MEHIGSSTGRLHRNGDGTGFFDGDVTRAVCAGADIELVFEVFDFDIEVVATVGGTQIRVGSPHNTGNGCLIEVRDPCRLLFLIKDQTGVALYEGYV